MDAQSASPEQRLSRLVEHCRDEMAADLTRLLMFSTVSGSTDPEEKRLYSTELSRAFSFLSSLARQMGFEWRNYDNRVAVVEQSGGQQVIGLPLHLDVVPSGEGWHYPAFGGMVEDGVIYGRGAQDNKGPIIQMLYALHCLRQLGLPWRRSVRLIVASQEETGDWSDIEFYLEKEPAPDLSIVADSEFPIVNGEKGMVDLEVRLRWNKPLEQNSSLQFQSLVGGERPNVVPNRAEMTWALHGGQARGVSEILKQRLEAYIRATPGADAFPIRISRDADSDLSLVQVTFLGVSAHSSTPELGHNALLDALRFVPQVPDTPAPLAELARFLLASCENLQGEGLGIARSHDFLGATTASLDILRVDNRGAEAVINIRPTWGSYSRQILQTARSRMQIWAVGNDLEAEVKFRGRPYEPLFVDPEKHPELIGALQRAYSEVTQRPATLIAKGGTTFAKAFPNALSFGPVDPADEKALAHQADECLSLDNLVRNTRIYALALMRLACDLASAETGGCEPSGGSRPDIG